MPPIKYHTGQLALQKEANTTLVAEHLAYWVGPVVEFARDADLMFFAQVGADGALRFTVLSGAHPLVSVLNGPEGLRLRLPSTFPGPTTTPALLGGLVINLGNARRARINGSLVQRDGQLELASRESHTSCKKYIAPSISLDDRPHIGPLTREPIALDDPWLTRLSARAETTFFASLSPEGLPDVAHRGGPPGFLHLDAAAGSLTWDDYVGDGVFKSAGNLHMTHTMTLLVPDFETGDGVELVGRGDYETTRSQRTPRLDALEQHREDFPVQGVIRCKIDRAIRLRGLLALRQRLEHAIKITSRFAPSIQAPQ